MRLRTQLALFFILMTGSVLAVGLMTVWGGIQVVERFSSSLTAVERLNQVRGLQNLLSREISNIDIFTRTHDPKEWERFRASHEVVALRFKELFVFDWDQVQNIHGPADRHDKIRPFLARIPGRQQTLPQAIAGMLDVVAAGVNDIETALSEDVRLNQQGLRLLVGRGANLIFGFIFWELLLGFLFALSTFRTMHRALHSLQVGTEAFGVGHFDHRIPVRADDELGDLARSFNEMADNIKSMEVKTVHMHRMSAVGQLAGGVAHEINNPLTGVLGQAQILLEKMSADDPGRPHVEKIERAAVRCRRIVRSLLDFSRQKETHFAQYDLHESVDSTIELCEPDFHSRRVQIVKNLSPLIPPMTGNGAQLQQVFLNLVSNALHAMPNGGTLTVDTALAAFVPPGVEGKKVDGVEILFQDTGGGIDPEHLSHVFEPFFTTKEIGKGTGLGLSVSLGIVRNHGGDIQVESEGKGKGALFRVLLPLSPPARLTASTSPGPLGGDAASGTRFGS